jgi:hypothetical protein
LIEKLRGILSEGMYVCRVMVEHELLHSLIDLQEHRKEWQDILNKGKIRLGKESVVNY